MTPLRTQYDEVAKGATARPWHVTRIGDNVYVSDENFLMAEMQRSTKKDETAALITFCVNNFEAALDEIRRLEARVAELEANTPEALEATLDEAKSKLGW